MLVWGDSCPYPLCGISPHQPLATPTLPHFPRVKDPRPAVCEYKRSTEKSHWWAQNLLPVSPLPWPPPALIPHPKSTTKILLPASVHATCLGFVGAEARAAPCPPTSGWEQGLRLFLGADSSSLPLSPSSLHPRQAAQWSPAMAAPEGDLSPRATAGTNERA